MSLDDMLSGLLIVGLATLFVISFGELPKPNLTPSAAPSTTSVTKEPILFTSPLYCQSSDFQHNQTTQ